MRVGELKELLNNFEDDEEVFVRNSVNPTGNIAELEQVEKATYGFFGKQINCLILNTYYNTPDDEIDRDADVAIKSFKDSRLNMSERGE